MSGDSKPINLVIVNTGCANIYSVQCAFERLGVEVTVSDNPAVIKSADKVLLPGVGSAFAAMKSIEQKQLTSVIQSLTQPVLGICLGMQLMAKSSNEKPGSHLVTSKTDTVECLGLIPTVIERMEAGDLVLPHMGWNEVTLDSPHPLFKNIEQGAFFYFVHSFCAPISVNTLAKCNYHLDFSAAIYHNNFFGVQFHPERSGKAGEQLLRNFIEL
ncbi:imidazole glycerol phosphate synthase subunit HisH [Psychrosphaera haliotis]|uniref:imidazole glycerol phosphate synthase subunit HisH n=1 Tax=Psychrosphaera haliotis TaxID=555083 RepID=UPI0031E391B8